MRLALDDHALRRLILDDVPYLDLTTQSLGIGNAPGRVEIFSRNAMTVCGTEEAARLFELEGASPQQTLASGTEVGAGETLLVAHGAAEPLLIAWKVAQTLIEYASGIATAASSLVSAVHAAGFNTPVACTRKHFPGTKAIAVKAVLAGGAIMHRLGLSETLLVFPEHRAFIAEAVFPLRMAQLKQNCPEKKLVVEVTNTEDALLVARLGADVVQLEKLLPTELRECKAALDSASLHPILAVAGGVTIANVVDYASAGADLLVSSAPYFSRPMDVQVVIAPQ
jgi:molybdenum transport protein